MALRRRLPADLSEYPMPTRGVTLNTSLPLIEPQQAQLMQNLVLQGGLQIRDGSGRENDTVFAAGKRITGLTKYYFGGNQPTGVRLVSYGTTLAKLSTGNVPTVLSSSLADDKDVHFTTWSITDRVYISDGVNALAYYDGNTDTYAVLTGTNIPSPKAQVIPVLDRLLCITNDGIERSDSRDDSVWSKNSDWATLRPSQTGQFTALHPIMMRSSDTLYHGAFAFQPNAFYIILGTNYGDVAGDDETNDDSSIRLMNTNVGTLSPYSIEEVPQLGLFWFTSDLNVYFMPHGQLQGELVGTDLRSVREGEGGIESCSINYIDQVWMKYVWPYLMLGFPSQYSSYTDIQYWMDVRQFRRLGPVWYGPMIGQSLSRVSVERQLNDVNKIIAGEGNSNNGAYIYRLRKPKIFTDDVGAVTNNVSARYRSFYNPFQAPNVEKRIRSVHMDMNAFEGDATLSLWDIDGEQVMDAPIERFVEA